MLSVVLQAILEPGVSYSKTLQPDEFDTLSVTHDSLKYSFFFALEGDTTSERYNGLLCKSAANYSDCSSQAGRCYISNNTRTECKVNQTGDYKLFIKNTGKVAGKFYLVYDDSVLVVPPKSAEYVLADYSASGVNLRIPVCSNTYNFTINTNGTQVYYGYNSGRPTKLLSGTYIAPEYPGFLYITIKDANATFYAYQYGNETIELDGYIQTTVASWKGCTRVFRFYSPGAGKNITVAASEIDDSIDGKMNMYYRENFTGNNYATATDNNGYSEEQLLRQVVVSSAATSAITVEFETKYGWLPHWYLVNKNMQLYSFMYYITSNSTGILPGEEISYNFENKTMVIAIPFRSSRQALQTNNEYTKSNYVIRLDNFDNKQSGNTTLTFGHTTPHDNSFYVVNISKGLYESSANYTDNNTYQNDLFFANIICYNVLCTGKFRAVHSYKLQSRIPVFFGHQSWEKNLTQFYMHYDLRDKGMHMRINHTENITIYVSQEDMMPNITSPGVMTFTCYKGALSCEVVVSERYGIKPNVDLHITVVSANYIEVIAADIGDNVLELKEAVPYVEYLYMGNVSTSGNVQFVFNPNYQSPYGDDRTKEATLFNFEAMQVSPETLPADVKVGIYVSSEVNPGPDNYVVKRMLREGQLEQSVYDKNVTKLQLTLPTPYGKQLYVGVYCEGTGCKNASAKLDRIQFRLTAYTTEEMATQSADVMQYDYFYARPNTMMEYFSLVDEETAKLSIKFASDESCRNISYRVYVCMGAIASPGIIDANSSYSYCFFYRGDSNRSISTYLDSADDRISAGNVYVTIIPDFTQFSGSMTYVDNCKNLYTLFKSEQIADFQQAYYGEIYQPGILNGVHFMAKVPAITYSSVNKTNPFGDRLVVKIYSNKRLRICVSDILDVFYPSPMYNQCLGGSAPLLLTTDYFALNFDHYLNQKSTGHIVAHTNVYFSIWTEEDLPDREKCYFNITVAPQAVLDPRAGGYPSKFVAKQVSGLDRYVNYAFNLTNLSITEREHMAFTAGPYCNDSNCRAQAFPDEFYGETLITSVSAVDMLPTEENAEANFYNKGPSIFQLDTVINTTAQMVYITLEYRLYYKLTYNNRNSGMAYQVDVIQDYNVDSQNIDYQTTKTRSNTSNNTGVMDYYHSQLSYIPSEIIIFPCKGKPAVLLDTVSPMSHPAYGDYQIMLSGEWGKPMYYYFYEQKLAGMYAFISVFDQQKFDFSTGKFLSDKSQMEYEVSIGSYVESVRPGNRGQISVVSYSPSGKGKVTVRFYPAAVPNQQGDLASLNYYMYAIPYQGSFDYDSDYSPYTACGARKIGHAIYKNSVGYPYLEIDEEFVKKHGYAEVTSNYDLWDQAPPGAVLYVTILTDQAAYTGVLAGQKEASAGLLMAVTFTIVILIIFALLLVFWMLFIRLRKYKISGYKPVTE